MKTAVDHRLVRWHSVHPSGNRQADMTPRYSYFPQRSPIAVFKLKNSANAQATTDQTVHDLQTYNAKYPALFTYNELLMLRMASSPGVARSRYRMTEGSIWELNSGPHMAKPTRR
ncbi:hypothetical protein [Sulfobacillus thermosulfidooxidans]|uniref:hypothetical protein n=1 Tax=Sulfobacillus thermosulfidooxidans TaxID=28034 RepID=UPI0009FC22ED|nr:hypothetical protein [Sulfobacillus thermosulfidooxidans]